MTGSKADVLVRQKFIFDPVSSCAFHLDDNPNLEIFVNRLDNANSVHYRLPLSTSSDHGHEKQIKQHLCM